MRELSVQQIQEGGGLHRVARSSRRRHRRNRRGGGIVDWMKSHKKTTAALGYAGLVGLNYALTKRADARAAWRAANPVDTVYVDPTGMTWYSD